VPGYEPSFSQPIRDNILESISQIDGQVVIKVFGDDIATLKDRTERVLETVRMPGESRLRRSRTGRWIVPSRCDRGQYVHKDSPSVGGRSLRTGVSEGTQVTNSKQPRPHSCESRVKSAVLRAGEGLAGWPAWYSGSALHDE